MRPTALITGASSGIGMEFAGILAREGYDLFLVARTEERLAQVREALVGVYDVTVTYLALDLGSPGAPEALVEALATQGITVDLLVNNAGIGLYGHFIDESIMRLRSLMRLNMIAPTILARLVGASMADRGRGRILNVGSVASFMPGPWMAAYYASKAYLLSLSEALATELGPMGIQVTVLCPGPTGTSFFREAQMEGSGLVRGRTLASSKSVAEYGYRALLRGRRVAVPGLWNKMAVFALRFLPRSLVTRFVQRLQAP